MTDRITSDPLGTGHAGDPLGLAVPPPHATLPVVALVVGAVAVVVAATLAALDSIHRRELDRIDHSLTADVDRTMALLDTWAEEQRRTAATWADDPELVRATEALLGTERTPEALVDHLDQAVLRTLLRPTLDLHGYQGFFVVAPDRISVASTRDSNTGTRNLVADEQPERLDRMFAGESLTTVPQASDVALTGRTGELVAEPATMFVGAPIKRDGLPIAVLLFRIDVTSSLNPVFLQARTDRDGELIAFDGDARLLTPSRSADLLRSVGLRSDAAFEPIPLVDPGVPLVAGRPAPDLTDRPLTRMAAAATTTGDGADVDGYRSYHGGRVLGAWRWNEELGLGLASEEPAGPPLAGWRFTRNVVLAFAASVAALMIGLGWYLGRSRPRLLRSEEVAATRARRLRSVLDQSSDGLLLVGADRRVVLANEATLTLFGHDPDELVGRPVDVLVDPAVRTAHQTMVEQFLAGHGDEGRMAPLARQVLGVRRDGTAFPAEVTLSRIELDSGELALASVRDLTTDIRAVELDQAYRELERLTAVAAHDLKEPLRKVETLSDLLAVSMVGEPETRHMVERIQGAASRMRVLADDLGRYIDWSTRELRPAAVPLDELLDTACRRLRTRPDGARLEVRVDDLPTVWGDPDQLTELFRQLFDNSLTFGPSRPMVTVRERARTYDMHTLTIEDNGPGFPAEVADRIFDAFRTLDRTGAGSGIGLAICRRIVERHQGQIRAGTSGDGGMTILIELPRRREAEAVLATVPSAQGRQP